jgi:hypothetical protein
MRGEAAEADSTTGVETSCGGTVPRAGEGDGAVAEFSEGLVSTMPS